MRPCDCKHNYDAQALLQEQGIKYNNNELVVRPPNVIIKIGNVQITIPMKLFKRFAKWYLEDQEV